MQIKVTRESVVLQLGWLFGVLNLPFALIAIMDLSGAFLVKPPHLPRTAEQWMGFLTAVAIVAGAISGFTVRSQHSMRRKIIHLLNAALAVILIIRSFLVGLLFVIRAG